ncbi:MAG TPA: hypothetical protein VJ063_18420 [Verrucomicrobiae bacterium]|nr:hypothetical protein [Verrucomicrobiae bacterium]
MNRVIGMSIGVGINGVKQIANIFSVGREFWRITKDKMIEDKMICLLSGVVVSGWKAMGRVEKGAGGVNPVRSRMNVGQNACCPAVK